jgi:hypothetical protein
MKENGPKILAGTKTITNRIATDFRMLCRPGDIMHLFTGLRTKNVQSLGDAVVLRRSFWHSTYIPCKDNIGDYTPIFTNLTWRKFIELDGFDNYNDFVKFFSHKRYEGGIYSYQFAIQDTLDKWIDDNEKIKAFKEMTGKEYKDLIRALRK